MVPPQASTHLLSQHKACKRKGKAYTHGPELHDVPVLYYLASLAPLFLLLSFPKATKQPGGYKERSSGETNKLPVLSQKTSHQGNKTLMLKQQFCDCFLSHKFTQLYCVNTKQSLHTRARPTYPVPQGNEQWGSGNVNTDLAVGLSLP